jgi:hypothetical protein
MKTSAAVTAVLFVGFAVLSLQLPTMVWAGGNFFNNVYHAAETFGQDVINVPKDLVTNPRKLQNDVGNLVADGVGFGVVVVAGNEPRAQELKEANQHKRQVVDSLVSTLDRTYEAVEANRVAQNTVRLESVTLQLAVYRARESWRRTNESCTGYSLIDISLCRRGLAESEALLATVQDRLSALRQTLHDLSLIDTSRINYVDDDNLAVASENNLYHLSLATRATQDQLFQRDLDGLRLVFRETQEDLVTKACSTVEEQVGLRLIAILQTPGSSLDTPWYLYQTLEAARAYQNLGIIIRGVCPFAFESLNIMLARVSAFLNDTNWTYALTNTVILACKQLPQDTSAEIREACSVPIESPDFYYALNQANNSTGAPLNNTFAAWEHHTMALLNLLGPEAAFAQEIPIEVPPISDINPASPYIWLKTGPDIPQIPIDIPEAPIIPSSIQDALQQQRFLIDLDTYAKFSASWANVRLVEEEQRQREFLNLVTRVDKGESIGAGTQFPISDDFRNAICLPKVPEISFADMKKAFRRAAHREYDPASNVDLDAMNRALKKVIAQYDAWPGAFIKVTDAFATQALQDATISEQSLNDRIAELELIGASAPLLQLQNSADRSETISRQLYGFASERNQGISLFAVRDGLMPRSTIEPYKFETSDPALRSRIEPRYRQLINAEPISPQGRLAKELGLKALVAADGASVSGDQEDAEAFASVGLVLADLALGLAPGVGLVKDVYEGVTGISLLTGQPLSDFDRNFAIAGMVTGGLVSKISPGLKAIGKLLGRLGEARAVAPIVQGAQRIVYVMRQAEWSRRIAEYGAHIPEDLTELEKLNMRLGREEIGSLFDSSCYLKPEIVAQAKEISNIKQLRNPEVIRLLEADGSNIADWKKMKVVATMGKEKLPEKTVEIHFYFNPKTKATNFDIDYKIYAEDYEWALPPKWSNIEGGPQKVEKVNSTTAN